MILISHRGNVKEKIEDEENHPDTIKNVISLGYDVEIDIRYIDNNWYLGHDAPQYIIKTDWLIKYSNKLWIHCKNLQAFSQCNNLYGILNYFFHGKDKYTLTSKQIIWAYPGSELDNNTICVLPELFDYHIDILKRSRGICTDNIFFYEEVLRE
jgi:hypothetical protein